VIGEDSGLCVDALGGAPGVYSARYADDRATGQNATDQSNNQKLLDELRDVPLEKRTAHYECHIALADPEGNLQLACKDICRGRIGFEPAGRAGFGYDPVFEVIEYHRTFGQLGEAVKAAISHRARATRQFITRLSQVISRS
jgi:XTP/dITP diphosphohydrolase